MKKILVILILATLVLGWNFIFSPSKKVQLTDPAKVLQGLSLALRYKIAVAGYWQQHQSLPSAEDWQKLDTRPRVDTSKSLVTDIKVGAAGPGSITVSFSNKDVINVAADITGKTIILMPIIIDNKLDWVCYGDVQAELMPQACQYRE